MGELQNKGLRMTSSTFANVFVAAADQAEAQADMGDGFFTAQLSETGLAPATYFWSTGYFLDSELDKIVNDVAWPRTVKFEDADQALSSMGLQPVIAVKAKNG